MEVRRRDPSLLACVFCPGEVSIINGPLCVMCTRQCVGCIAEGCEFFNHRRGLCAWHASMWDKGLPLSIATRADLVFDAAQELVGIERQWR